MLVDPQTVRLRIATCQQCPLYVKATGQCNPFMVGQLGRRGCGCFIIAKARLESETCPNAYWPV